VNAALLARFGAASVVPKAGADGARGGNGDCMVELRSPGRKEAIEVHARLIRMPDLTLLILDGGGAPEPEDEVTRLRGRISELEQLASTDHLTGAWNRAHFDRVIEVELARSLACRQPVSLVLLDIDHFKAINDCHGHDIGDAVLRELVQLVQSRIRASDFLFRWGGEEFAVLAATHGYRGAERLAENLRSAVAAHSFRGVGSVAISLGVAEHLGMEPPAAWFQRLDQALYAAKEGGRDRVVVDRRGNSDAWAKQAGVSALHLAWQEAFECGDPTIDTEHRELFGLANVLIDAAAHGQAEPARFRSALGALLTHVAKHFADEEAILAEHRYADLEQHKRAHAGLLRRADYLKVRVESGQADLGSVVEFLAQDVVARHLLAVDRAFFPLFAGKPADPAPPARR
jgi:diguanylate cyclase (GGDEF)-like protein/hemerythrin-like metal-binding protein